MPYKHGKRKKKRTHVQPTPGGILAEKVPRSFVLRRGKVDKTVKQLVTDTRQMMLPHTASHLKERKTNTLKDFVAVAGPLGVSHLVLFSQTENTGNIQLRIGRLAHGPTLTFRVNSFILAHQIKAIQKRPIDFTGLYLTPPLVVLHNFNTASSAANITTKESVSLTNALKLTQVTFQNMFPAINPATLKLVDCRRVLLVHYDRRTSQIELRHYAIRAVPVGVSKGVKKILLQSKIPDLGKLDDMAEFVLSGGKTGNNGGMTSDSEFEDEASKVILPQDYHGKGNQKSSQSAIKLTELGPRLSLSLVKIEDGLFNGEVLYHAFVSKTAEETVMLRKRAQEREELRQQRREEQASNVSRKLEAKEAKRKAKEERKAQRQAAAEKAAAEGKLGDDDDDDEDNEDHYRGRNVNDGDNDDDNGDADEEDASSNDVTDDDDDDDNDNTGNMSLSGRFRSSNTHDDGDNDEEDEDGHVEVDDINENDEVDDDDDDDTNSNEFSNSSSAPYTLGSGSRYEPDDDDSEDDDDDEDDDSEEEEEYSKSSTATALRSTTTTTTTKNKQTTNNAPLAGTKHGRDDDKSSSKIRGILKSSTTKSAIKNNKNTGKRVVLPH